MSKHTRPGPPPSPPRWSETSSCMASMLTGPVSMFGMLWIAFQQLCMEEEWTNIPQPIINSLSNSLQRRCVALPEANGFLISQQRSRFSRVLWAHLCNNPTRQVCRLSLGEVLTNTDLDTFLNNIFVWCVLSLLTDFLNNFIFFNIFSRINLKTAYGCFFLLLQFLSSFPFFFLFC